MPLTPYTFQTAIPVPETQIGIAFETTRGTAVAPEYWLPIMGAKYKPDLKLLPEDVLEGSMVKTYGMVPSLRYDAHGWDTYPYMDNFPVYLLALLGPDHKTAAATATTLAAEAKAGAIEKIKLTAEVKAGQWIVIDSGVGVMETREVAANTTTEITLNYPLAFTHKNGASVTPLTKHQFSLLNNADSLGNQPASCTITDFAGEEAWRQLTAAQLDSLVISGGADSLPKATVTWMANASIKPSTPSPSYTEVQAPPGWAVQAAIGSQQLGELVSWEWTLKRNVKPIPAITGNQNYFQFFAGPLEATAKLTVLENQEATWLKAYEAGEQKSVDLVLSDVKSGYALNLHSTKAKITTGELDRSKEWIEVPLEVQLLPSSTDALQGGVSPIVCTAANAITTEYGSGADD